MAIPELTVISGYYNRAHAAPESVSSILEQSYEDFELILFDDASTDDTLDVLRSFRDERIRILAHRKNLGFTKALLHAIEQARGSYLAIHGSGDISAPTRLEKQIHYLERHPDVGMVDCLNTDFSADGIEIAPPSPPERVTLDLLLRATPISHGSVMYRRSAYDAAGGYRPEFDYSQDRDLWLRLVQHDRIVILPEVLHRRYVHPDGASFTASRSVRQAQYMTLGNRLATASYSEREATLERVRDAGIDRVVPPDAAEVQRMMARRLVKLAKFGRWKEIEQLLEWISAPPDGATRALVALVRTTLPILRRVDADGAVPRLASRTLARIRSR